MTVNFALNPGYFSKIDATQVSASVYKTYGGQSSQCFMQGEDGNLYFPLFPFYFGLSTNAEAIGCAQTGNSIVLSEAQLTLDGAISASRNYTFLPCNGTKYFWVLGLDPGSAADWLYSGVLYKIVNDTTITKVGGFAQFATSTLPSGGGLLTDSFVFSIQMSPDLSRVYFAAAMGVFSGAGSANRCAIASLPVSEGTAVFEGWDFYPLLTDHFFNYATATFNYQALTLVPDEGPLGYHYLLTVNKAAYDYMVANPGDSASYALFTQPGVYLWRPDTAVFTDVSSQFGITDWSEHLDGSPSADLKDDYCGCSSFQYNGQSFVVFTKSYSLHADLNTTGKGTYVHTQIYQWDGEAANKSVDTHTALFDTVLDAGGSSGGTYSPAFVQSGLIGNDLYYLWGNTALPSTDSYAVGKLFTLSATNPGAYHALFSEFNNPDYVDWYSIGGADFDSELYTSFYLSSANSLFMEAPWVISYLDNTTDYVVDRFEVHVVDELSSLVYVMPSLLLTPRWEWTDSQSNHKSGPTLDVYQLRTKSTVSDKRTRVRGKGRALQLHWKSSPRKPFNLLGWAIQVEENASY